MARAGVTYHDGVLGTSPPNVTLIATAHAL